MVASCIELHGDCTLGRALELNRAFAAFGASDELCTLDVTGVSHADIAFVQLVVSASKTLEARGRGISVVGLSENLLATFRRAGLGIDRDTGRVSVLEG